MSPSAEPGSVVLLPAALPLCLQNLGARAAHHPPGPPTRDGGSYLILFFLSQDLRLDRGPHAGQLFPAGLYAYAGNAARSRWARIARHLRPQKKLHWHIDSLTSAPGFANPAALLFDRPDVDECRLVREMDELDGAQVVTGFGASDCRQGCGGHLLFLGSYLA